MWSPIQRRLLQASLNHVPTYGWTSDAVAAAAIAAGLQLSTTGLIVAPRDMIHFQMDEWKDQLRQDLQKLRTEINPTYKGKPDQPEHGDWESITHVERLYRAMKLRLQYETELIRTSHWTEAMAFGARPDNLPKTTKQLEELIKVIADDTTLAADKPLSALEQFGLGGVYVATELHLLADPTRTEEETWEFLRIQIGNWDRLRRLKPPTSGVIDPYTVSSVGSAVASGLLSLTMPSSMDFLFSPSRKK